MLGIGLGIQFQNIASFSPAHLSGFKLWLDASRINQADNTPIAQWDDVSGSGFHATQAVSGAQPTLQTNELNGLPVVRFDGTDDYLGLVTNSPLGLFKNVAGASVFTVIKYPVNSLNNFSFYASTGTSGSVLRIAFRQSTTNIYRISGTILDADSITAADSVQAVSGFKIQTGIYDATNADMFQYINGALDGSNLTYGTAGNTSNTDSLSITIGRAGLGTSFLNGDIAEILAFNRKLTTAEILSVHQYLSRKWGIALA